MRTKGRAFTGCQVSPIVKQEIQEYASAMGVSEAVVLRRFLVAFLRSKGYEVDEDG